ncbi:hypothetical protein ES703_26650 [subsurface metagenome]
MEHTSPDWGVGIGTIKRLSLISTVEVYTSVSLESLLTCNEIILTNSLIELYTFTVGARPFAINGILCELLYALVPLAKLINKLSVILDTLISRFEICTTSSNIL